LVNAQDHISASFGPDSWSLAFWNVFAAGPIDAANDAYNGHYGKASFAAVLVVLKLNRVQKYAGGAFGKLKRIVGWERHHMPADSVSPLTRARGPAIHMEEADHALTASYGSSATAQAYRKEIGALISEGRWRDAMALEIRDVRRVAGSKYNEAIQEMLEYARSTGIID